MPIYQKANKKGSKFSSLVPLFRFLEPHLSKVAFRKMMPVNKKITEISDNNPRFFKFHK